MNNLIERSDERVVDIFKRLARVDKILDGLDAPTRRTLGGQRFLTDSELSKILRISRRTLLEYRSQGAIPYYLICGKILYSEGEIQQFLEKSRRSSLDEREVI